MKSSKWNKILSIAKKKEPTDPKALYEWGVTMVGSTWMEGSGLTYEEVTWLMKHFNVDTPEELVGMRFRSHRGPSGGLDELIFRAKKGPDYVPPTKKEIFEGAAKLWLKRKSLLSAT